ncbi:hypothetical protein KKG22_01680 [Patescibacteria group bacterium]|nr:hypothetical protein [Patescibacteria group bacterium]
MLARQRDSFPLLNSEAQQYYLPAYMTFAVMDPEEADVLVDSLIWALTDKITLS